jgi:chromosome segregation ATPase
LSPFAFVIGAALVVLIAAATAWAVRTGGGIRRGRSYDWVKLPSELPTILGEFQHSIEGAQEDARRAAKTSEAIMAAVGPIELALRDFKKRITELEKRTDENERQSAELKSSLVERQVSLEGNTRAIERSNARLDGFDQQSRAVADTLSGLKQTTENGISQHKAASEELRAINSALAAIQARLTGLSQRVDVEETGQAHLSALAESVANAVAALKNGSNETAQRIAALEPRVLWRIEELEALINSAGAAISHIPANDRENAGRIAGTNVIRE